MEVAMPTHAEKSHTPGGEWKPTQKVEQDMLPAYRSWSKDRRFRAAVQMWLDGTEHNKSQLARNFGVSLVRLRQKIQAAEAEQADMAERRQNDALEAVGSGLHVSEERRRVPQDFWEFDRMYFGHWTCPDCVTTRGTPARHKPADFHREMIEASYDPDVRRLLVNVPPYHAKTTYLSVKRTVHQLVKDPNYRLLLISASKEFGQTVLHSIDEILTNPDLYIGSSNNLIEDWGPFRTPGTTWNAEQIYVTGRTSAEKDPTIQVSSIGSRIYGKRADEVLFDDVVDLDRSRNPEQVMKDLEWIAKMPLSRIGKRGRAIFVGTRVGPGDIYSHLAKYPSYRVLKYPAIIDEATDQVLWGEHFPMSQIQVQRDEMTDADFQLVYQQVELPGVGASFTADMVDQCKNSGRGWGQYDNGWILVAGLDPAGANQHSGYTAMMLMGLDPMTGKRYLIDIVNVRQMKAPQIYEQMVRWATDYPLFEWRVESNGLQSQLVQYNTEITNELLKHGTKVQPHFTHGNKWDPQFGVESMAPLFQQGMMDIPWMDTASRHKFQPLVDQLLQFPMGQVQDCAMALWFADLAARDVLRRQSVPMFDSRMKVPKRIMRGRRVVDFANREVRHVPEADQRPGHLTDSVRNLRRMTSDLHKPHQEVAEFGPEEAPQLVNVERPHI